MTCRGTKHEGTNKPGAGRPSPIQHLKDQLKQRYRAEEKAHGYSIADADVLLIFKELLAERLLELLRLERAGEYWNQTMLEEKQVIENRTPVVQCKKNRANLLSDLLHFIKRTTRVPKKRDMLTEAEEKQRAHLTWQDFDFMIYLCTVCPETLRSM